MHLASAAFLDSKPTGLAPRRGDPRAKLGLSKLPSPSAVSHYRNSGPGSAAGRVRHPGSSTEMVRPTGLKVRRLSVLDIGRPGTRWIGLIGERCGGIPGSSLIHGADLHKAGKNGTAHPNWGTRLPLRAALARTRARRAVAVPLIQHEVIKPGGVQRRVDD